MQRAENWRIRYPGRASTNPPANNLKVAGSNPTPASSPGLFRRSHAWRRMTGPQAGSQAEGCDAEPNPLREPVAGSASAGECSGRRGGVPRWDSKRRRIRRWCAMRGAYGFGRKGHFLSWRHRLNQPSPACTPGCATCLSMAPMPDRNCAAPSIGSANGRSKSSNVPTPQRASKSSPGAGSSNAPSHGSGAVAVWQKTGKNQSLPAKPGSISPTSDLQSEDPQGFDKYRRVSSQALRYGPALSGSRRGRSGPRAGRPARSGVALRRQKRAKIAG